MEKVIIKEQENGELLIITQKKTYCIYAELEYKSKTGRINYGGEYVVKLKIR